MAKPTEKSNHDVALLKKQKGILQHMVDCTRNMHLVYLDRDFNFVCVNQAYAVTCGYKPEEMIGKNHFVLYPNKENEEIFRRVRDTGVPAQFHDKPFVFPDQPKRGVTYWDWTLQPIKNKVGEVEGLVFSLVETTERKRSEVALNETKILLDSTVNSTKDMIWSVGVGKDFRLLTFNKALSDFFLETQNLHIKTGMRLKELMPTEQLYRRWRALNKKALKVGSFTAEYAAEENSRILELTFNVLKSGEEAFGIAVFAKDITERKKAEDELKASEERFNKAFNASPSAISVTRFSDGLFVDINQAYLKLSGFSRQEVIGKKTSDLNLFVGTNSRSELLQSLQRKGNLRNFEINFRTKSGKIVNTLLSIDKINLNNQDYLLSTVTDITETKKAQKQIEEYSKNLERLVEERTKQLSLERARLFNVLEGLHIMLCLLNADRRVVFANLAFREKFGECDGKYCYEYFGKESPCGFCESYKVLTTGKMHQWLIQSAGGGVIQAYDYPFTDVDGTKMVLEVAFDITEQIQMQKQLKDSERLAAIGATAGMVGHDIRNPLQAIVGELYLARITTALIPDSEIKAAAMGSLDFIEEQVYYINKIVVDLQDYARPIVPAQKDTNLKALFADILAKQPIPENIKVSSKVEVRSHPCTDPHLLQRILANLVSNAVQAMPNGGNLTLNASKRDDELVITVNDTGTGIPAEVQAKMFTPLFTTKSKGQGFGLAVVKRMTEAMGGTVSFETQPTKGTKFVVRLPFK